MEPKANTDRRSRAAQEPSTEQTAQGLSGPCAAGPRFPVAKVLTVLMLAAVLVTSLTLPGAWRETQRREAFLPTLKAEARRDPYDGRLLALLGGRLMEAGDYSAAAEALERAVNAGEKTEAVWLTLASAKAASGDGRALGYLHVGARETNTPGMRAALERCRALGNSSTPLTVAEAICPDGPEPLVAAYTQGSFLNGAVQWWGRHHPNQSGFETRRQWAAQQPDDAQAQRLWGLALAENRRLSQAAFALQRAVALAPNSADAHLALADVWNSQALPAQASVEYVEALKRHRDWLPALLGLGRATLAEDMPVTAADIFSAAVRIGPQSADAWAGLGEADVAAQKNGDTALRAFLTAARLAPARTDFLADYATALRQVGRMDEAEALLRRRITADPTDARSRYLLAGLLLDSNSNDSRLNEAQAQLDEAIRLAPQAWPARQQMALLLLRRKKPEEAIQRLHEVLKEAPGNVNAWLTLAHADQLAGRTAQSAQASARAAVVSKAMQRIDVVNAHALATPSDIEAHRQLAALYRITGQADKARQEQEAVAVLRAHPAGHSEAAQSLAALVASVLAPR